MLALLQRVESVSASAGAGDWLLSDVSAQTADNAFLRLMVKKLNNLRPEAPRMTDKEMRQRLIAISAEWYKADCQPC